MKFLGTYYWYVKMPRCWCVENRLEYITFYVKNIYITLGGRFWTPTGSRRVIRGRRICGNRLLTEVKAGYGKPKLLFDPWNTSHVR